MFDVGFTEVFLLAVIGLLVLGPERLPAVARTLGAWIRKARSSWYTLKRSIEAEMSEADIRGSIRAAGDELKAVSRQVSDTIDSAAGPRETGAGEDAGSTPAEQTREDREPDPPGP